ncbi:MAG: hypothetical protein ACLP59_04985 [Bryobacteraceae bacterium]
MSKSEWTGVAIGGGTLALAAIGAYAAYLGLDRTGKESFVATLIIISVVSINMLAAVLLVFAIIRNLHDAHRVKALRARADQTLPLIRHAAVLQEYADVAGLLCSKLEDLRSHWSSAGQELARPLARTVVDQLKGWPRNDTPTLFESLVEFRGLYEYHVRAVKSNSPKFSSNVITSDYPCYDPIITVLTNLQIHTAKLKEEGHRMMEASKVA